MKVLVAYASKYGATAEIARRIALRLREQGLSVDVVTAGEADVAGYDAVVLGSAVYIGSWLKEATQFVERNRGALSSRPLWLFSSGPISTDTGDAAADELREKAVKNEIAQLREALAARDHRVFYGALDRGKLRIPDKWFAAMPAFPGSEGDFRDWDEIDEWARGVAGALTRAGEPVAAS